MASIGGATVFLAGLCLVVLVDISGVQAQTTWLAYFTSTQSTLNWNKLKATYGTWPNYNFTTIWPFWDVTTRTSPPTTSTIAVTEELVTTPPEQPEVIESTDTIFLSIIIACCLIGLILYSCLVFVICKMMNKKHKKTKRLRVKPLKADQAFATVMNPGMGMMGMDPMGMGGGMMPPMDTGMMAMPGAMDPFGGMDPNAMGGDPMGGMNFDPMGGEKNWMA